jgi:hypothetical protein
MVHFVLYTDYKFGLKVLSERVKNHQGAQKLHTRNNVLCE